ncbi:hypothetical protein ENBRE01_0254 [Enteropsectra breve]|nr:hypothetical protein ENBRE01_0254 [Enteropsectra breve]
MEHEAAEIYFRGKDDVDKIAAENPALYRIYLNKKKDGNKSTIELTYSECGVLYILSNHKYDSFLEYFKDSSHSVVNARQRPKNIYAHNEIKREAAKKNKQQNLFSFFKQ